MQKKKQKRWIRKLYEERDVKGEYGLLVRYSQLYDEEMFFRFFRMIPKTYEMLLRLVAPVIKQKSTKIREPIIVYERLSVTLRYLTTGNAYTTISNNYRMSPTTVGRIVCETSNVTWEKLKEAGYIKTPSTVPAWKAICKRF